MRPPPRWLRRLLLQPLFIVLTLVLSVVSPVLFLGAALASPFTGGHWRPLRVAVYTVVWTQREVAVIIACAALWAIGMGRMDTPAMQHRHYGVMRWFFRGARIWGQRILAVTVHIDDDGLADQMLAANDRPLLVFSRHSGPGDTFYLVDMLLDRYGREPRIVMKEMLKLDPCIDVVGSRVHSYFLPPPARRRAGSWETRISELSRGLDARGALLLFPEGGNFSEERRRRRLRQLLRRGRRRDAERAVRMHHVIAPEPGGALTALAAAPAASVILVAHGGLSGYGHRGLLSRSPMDQSFRVHLWYVDASEIPNADESRRQWLLDCWQRIDQWVAADAGDVADGELRNGAAKPSPNG